MTHARSNPRRRDFCLALATLAASPLPPALATLAAHPDENPAPPLSAMLRHPLLVDSLYRLPVSDAYNADGAAGANQDGYKWIEEQRQGAEWIVRGSVQGRADWVALGWRQLDWGLARQTEDGGFASRDPFHSTAFFVEALARACLLDAAGATAARLRGLARGAAWLMSPAAEGKGIPNNLPYTHRRYILAAGFGQAGAVTGEPALTRRAEQWAREGLSLQTADGTNPEKNGFDAGYQMVGVLMALRYLPVCAHAGLRTQLRAMVRAAVSAELARQAPDGSIDASDSTRITLEHARSGKLKDVPYGEIAQALIYGAQAVPEPAWLEPARRIVVLRHWLRG